MTGNKGKDSDKITSYTVEKKKYHILDCHKGKEVNFEINCKNK